MKKLFVIRHAKSDLSNSNISDFDRPLNHRGLNDSQKIGDYINIEKPLKYGYKFRKSWRSILEIILC